MPTLERDGCSIYYNYIGGPGELLLVLAGIGSTEQSYQQLIDQLVPWRRILTVHTRGSGFSVASGASFALEDVADGVVAVLEAEGIDAVDVLGISMGGMIAQALALRAPDRVGRLVLCSTSCGGAEATRPDPEVVVTLANSAQPSIRGSVERMAETVGPLVFAEKTPRAVRLAYYGHRATLPKASPVAYLGQMMASQKFDVSGDLHGLRARTLVVAGVYDRLIPPENAVLLARLIPMASLWTMEDAGHLCFLEQTEQFVERVRAFLNADR